MPKRIQNRPEEQLHCAVADYLTTALPSDAWFCHVPNGGARTPHEGKAFKAMGTKPGVPDVLICHQGRAFWVELKPEKKRNWKNGGLSDNQVQCHAD